METGISTHLEELAANAWPGLRNVLMDGWVARFADGYTRRANSVLPLYSGSSPVEGRVRYCERLATLEGVRTTFKIFPGAQPESLDGELERLGYAKEASANVMVLDSLGMHPSPLPEGALCQISSRLGEEWFGCYLGEEREPRKVAALRAIMGQIVPDRRFVLLKNREGPLGCALTVIEDGWAGVFDVMVPKPLRGRGLGRTVMEWTLSEAAAAGARRSYLQVMVGNTPAERLYQGMGYRQAYTYWYRVKESATC